MLTYNPKYPDDRLLAYESNWRQATTMEARTMDPNANLDEQAECSDPKRLRELRQALLAWMHHGGFEPDWDAQPYATKDFDAWRIATIGY